MNKKMIVVDLDGTLLNINQKCSLNTKRYLKELKDLEYIIVIATGRVLRSAVGVTDGAEFADYIIASSGAVIYDMNNKKVIMKSNIDLSSVRKICSSYGVGINDINLCDLFYHHKYTDNQNYCPSFTKRVVNIDNFLSDTDGIVNVTIHFGDNKYVYEYLDKFNDMNLEFLIMQDSFSNRKCLEIFNKDVSKYNAIKEICMIEGISNKNVIAFGDGLNDVDMVKLSGIGVAMGNALDEVKLVSDYITISHNDDGVVYFLKEYLD